jgi:hypothetical protein
VTFQNANGTEDIGGALYITVRSFSLTGTAANPILFTNNHLAPTRTEGNPVGGGAVGVNLESSFLSASNVVFRNNSVTGLSSKGTLGGAVFCYQGTLELTNAVFENNRAVSTAGGPVGGGAIASEFMGPNLASKGVFIYGGSFAGNEALLNYNSSQAAIGGAIMVQDQQLTLEGSSGTPILFKNNKATHAYSGSAYGGAVAVLNNQAGTKFSEVRFEANSAANASGGNGYGGAVYVQGKTDQQNVFTRADFDGNSAQRGGALYVHSGNVELNDVNIVNNVGDFGGALYANSSTNVSFNVSAAKTSVISGNKTSGGQVSGIYLNSVSSFTVNTEAGAVLDMRDSITGSAKEGTQFLKTGAGIWKMGGENKITSADSTKYSAFSIEGGSVEMLAGSSLVLEGGASTFDLAAGASFDVKNLSATAAVNISGTLTLSSKAVVRFDSANLNSTTAIIHAGKFGLDIAVSGEKVVIDVDNLPADAPDQRYALFTFDDLVSDYGTGGDANDYFVMTGTNSRYYSFEWDDGILYIIQNIPEPSALAAVFGMMALLVAAYRRKN